MSEYISFAKELALKAGEIMRANFDKDLEVETKQDDSPVTRVDKEINQLVLQAIKNTYPDHGLLGEEADLGDGSERFQWICDPLDGTKPYVLGIPTSVFMLGLAEDTQVVASVVYDPYADRLFSAVKGQGAYCNDVLMRVSQQPLKGGYILLGSTEFHIADSLKAVSAKTMPISGGGFKTMMVARGKAVGHIGFAPDFHDMGPASLIVEEAGGTVTDLSGKPLNLTKQIDGIITSNGIAHEALVAIARASITPSQP